MSHTAPGPVMTPRNGKLQNMFAILAAIVFGIAWILNAARGGSRARGSPSRACCSSAWSSWLCTARHRQRLGAAPLSGAAGISGPGPARGAGPGVCRNPHPRGEIRSSAAVLRLRDRPCRGARAMDPGSTATMIPIVQMIAILVRNPMMSRTIPRMIMIFPCTKPWRILRFFSRMPNARGAVSRSCRGHSGAHWCCRTGQGSRAVHKPSAAQATCPGLNTPVRVIASRSSRTAD